MSSIPEELWFVAKTGLLTIIELARDSEIDDEKLDYVKMKCYEIFVNILDFLERKSRVERLRQGFLCNESLIASRSLEEVARNVNDFVSLIGEGVLVREVEHIEEPFPVFEDRLQYLESCLKDAKETLLKLEVSDSPPSSSDECIPDDTESDARHATILKLFIERNRRKPHLHIDSEKGLAILFSKFQREYRQYKLPHAVLIKLFPFLK
jgi:hypothetical protein